MFGQFEFLTIKLSKGSILDLQDFFAIHEIERMFSLDLFGNQVPVNHFTRKGLASLPLLR